MRLDNGALTVVQPFFSMSVPIPGAAGQLSPDGNYALTHDGDGRPAAYDVRSGDPQGTRFVEDWTPVEAAFTLEGRAVWVVQIDDASYGMFDCQVSRRFINSFDPDTEPCTPRIEMGEPPLLAGMEPGLVPSA